MDKKLKDAIVTAVQDNTLHIFQHLERDMKMYKNNHSHIDDFQDGVLDSLKEAYKQLGQNIWEKEQKKNEQKSRDSVDILGEISSRKCIIEIDAVRHDQIAAKFVSRLAIWGLDEPIDYVAILYDSTQESGPQSARKYVEYMYDILKKINQDSSLLGIYVDKKNKYVEIWDLEAQKFSISDKSYNTMNECARDAVELFIKNNPRITFEELQKAFLRTTHRNASYISPEEGGSRAIKINMQTADKKDVFVYSQFRSSNWEQFVEVCKNNKITIELHKERIPI